jgi:ABC-type sugar transport system ATPase subunit
MGGGRSAPVPARPVSMTAATPHIQIAGLTRSFPGIVALDSVSLDFRPGEVHAVIGENGAGKSTMMNILAGDLQPNAGEIRVGGEAVRIANPLASRALGITVVYQELTLCPNLTVAENVMLSAMAARPAATLARRGAMREEARRALSRLGMAGIDLDLPVRKLSVAEMQLVEIARALNEKSRVLVLDEPNSALSPRESERLFDIVRQLRGDGVTVIYVSHHLSEVLALADRISVMRDGRLIETIDNEPGGVDEDRLIRAMVGRQLDQATQWSLREEAVTPDASVVLDVEGLTVPGQVDGLSFECRAGEILGIGGLPDSGKDVLGEAIFGLRERQGRVAVDGVPVPPWDTSAALRAGMAFVPADRRGAGALLTMSVADNVVSASLGRFSLAGFRKLAGIRAEARAQVARLDARITSLNQKLATLSGGNQQKIILGRSLVTNPRVLILQEPTRGVDVGAKAEIYEILRGIASEGVAIVMISSELPELMLNAARVIVMRDGRLSGELRGAEIHEEAILSRALA